MKTYLVLSGGGAKGSMQFGFIKYLVEQGLKVDATYGTSVGNLNAVGFAYKGVPGLEQVWGSIKRSSDVFKFNWKTLLFLSNGVYNANPLRAKLHQVIQGQPAIPCYSCAVDVTTGKIDYMSPADQRPYSFEDHAVASASIPGYCDTVAGMCDGGVREQTPLMKAIEDGAERIVVVLCNPWQKDPDPGKNGNWVQNVLRATDIMSHEIFLDDLRTALAVNANPGPGQRSVQIDVYAPEKLVIDSDEFDGAKIQAAIAYGYEQAKLGPIKISP